MDKLTPQEEAELRALEAASGELSPEEQAELAQLETQHTPAQQDGGAGMAALEGFGQTATMGYLPQLQAMAEKPMAKVMDFFTGSNVAEEMPDYVQRRDENIARQSAQASAHPMASMAGKAAGIGAGMLAPGLAAAKGATAAAKIGRGALVGAATGAAYNPGDEQGVVDPLQAGERAGNAVVGGLTGGALAGVGAGASVLARKHRMIDQVKNSAGLSKHVKGEVDKALSGVNQNYIKPRADQLQELLQGKQVEINPERIKGVSPGLDKLAAMLGKRTDDAGRATMKAPRAQRLKRALDARANYAQSKPFDVAAVAKGEDASRAAGIVRRKLEGVDPRVGPLNDEMREAINLRSALQRQSASAPIASIHGQIGTDKGSIIDVIDKMGGSNLERLATDITSARKAIIDPTNFVKPLQIANETRKVIGRGLGRASRGVEKMDDPASLGAALRALFEVKR